MIKTSKNWMLNFLIMIVIVAMLSNIVYSIGVSPIRKVVDFEPNQEHDLSIKIKNNDHKDLKALVYARGSLEEYIGITDSLVSISNNEDEKIAKYVLKLPDKLERPGTHRTDLVVVEYPSDFGTEKETTVSATASVVSELWVRVPYPGKYAEGELLIDAKGVNQDVNFLINVMNFGKEDIKEVKAVIKILGATYEEIGNAETSVISIDTKKQGQLKASWKADVNPGKYKAVAEIYYDEKKLVLEKTFEVGNLHISIDGIDVKDFSLGEIAVLDISVRSHWNEQINNVYGDITVLDSGGSQFSKFKTASVDLPAMGTGTLKGYWDTKDATVGKYNLRVLIHYDEKVTEKLIETEVNIDSIRTDLGITAEVTASKGNMRDTLLIVLVLILVIVNIAWFIYFAKKKK